MMISLNFEFSLVKVDFSIDLVAAKRVIVEGYSNWLDFESNLTQLIMKFWKDLST